MWKKNEVVEEDVYNWYSGLHGMPRFKVGPFFGDPQIWMKTVVYDEDYTRPDVVRPPAVAEATVEDARQAIKDLAECNPEWAIYKEQERFRHALETWIVQGRLLSEDKATSN